MRTNRALFLVFVCFFCLHNAYAKSVPVPVAVKGVLDLRNADLNQSLLPLAGEWKFHWNQLLFPANKSADTDTYIQVPALWNKMNIDGKPLPAEGFATYELTILLPHNRPVLALEVPDVYCSYALYINDSLMSSNGKPDTTAATSMPFWGTRAIRFPEKGDSARILMQVANFWHAKGGTYKPIVMGPLAKVAQKKDQEMAFDFILMGCLFMGGLFFLGLYLFGRRDNAILFFSLFCILYSYRMIGTDRYVLHTLFPDLSWFLTIRLEYLVLSTGVAMFALYTKLLFPEDSHKRIMQVMISFCLLFTGIVIVTPIEIFTGLLEIFLCVMFICIAYASYVYIQAARHRRSGSVYALMGTGLMMVIFTLSNLNYFGIIAPVKAGVFGSYIAFFFLQSLALSHRFAQSFRKATEEAQQGLKTKSEFLSTMSHEIRTPLNAVIGMTHVLLRKDPRKDQQEHLDVLLFSANNLLSIVNNILDYSKIEAGKISFENIPMDLRLIARNITSGLKHAAEEKGIDLRLEIDETIKEKVMGDPTRFSQVINNLVHNALKFTKEGWVCLKVKAAAHTSDAITVKISVEDTGIGIDNSKLHLIFERFSQAESSISRSYGGTGLGLAISKKILQLQGSELEVKSAPGKGSCFYFIQTFPLSNEKTETKEDDKNEKNLAGVKILLVEDHPFNVVLAKTILEGWGAEIDVATNGLEALNMLDNTKHQLILMDLHMPVMNGFEAADSLRKRGETLPIIALTANTPGEIETGLLGSGLTDILVKPFNPDDLYRVIRQYLLVKA